MKVSMLRLAIMFMAFFIAASASATEVSVGELYSLYSSENLESGRGVKLSVGSLHPCDGDTRIYSWASYEETLLRFGGQEMADMKIYGVGFGAEKRNWFIEFGYYVPKHSFRPSYKEALWLEINRILQPSYSPADYHDNEFGYRISGDFGASAGARIPMGRFFLSAMYRWLKFEDVITCRFGGAATHWETYSYRDFSGIVASLGYEW